MNFCEPSRFVSEQHRVLKSGGRMIIMDVYGRGVKPEEWIPADAVDLYLTLTHNENIKKHCNKRLALVCVIYSFLTTVTLPSGGCCSFIHSHRNSRVSFT